MSPDTVRPHPARDHDAPVTGGRADRTGRLVRELPAPPDLASEIEAFCRRCGFVPGRWPDWVADELKLQYHYGGKIVAVLQTDRGPVVLATGDSLESPEIAGLRESLTSEENERTVLESLPHWDDNTSRL